MEQHKPDLIIRNSLLSKYRMEVEGNPFPERWLKRYLVFGGLVDALITNPSAVDHQRRLLHLRTNYETGTYQFSARDFQLALAMRDAFVSNPFLGIFLKYAVKTTFSNPNFTFTHENISYLAHTEGELDLCSKRELDLGIDIKTTAAKSYKEFLRSVDKLYYDQQGKFYTDNIGISQFLIVGISKKVLGKNGLPALFFVPITENNPLSVSGVGRYSYWMHHYLAAHSALVPLRSAA